MPDATWPEGPSADELRRCGEMGAAAEAGWLDLAAGGDDRVREALGRKLAAMKAELGGPEPTSLERLLVERVALAWLVAGYSAAAVAGVPGRGPVPGPVGSAPGASGASPQGLPGGGEDARDGPKVGTTLGRVIGWRSVCGGT